MEAALAEAKRTDRPILADIARKHGVSRSALSRQFRGLTSSKQRSHEDHRALTNAQENELLDWIRKQCEHCLPPPPSLVLRVAAQLCGRDLPRSWQTRFVARHKDAISSRYLKTLDLARHNADTYESYGHYFDILRQKVEQYRITADNIYNMDEKGFLIGRLHKTKRVFCRDLYNNNKLPVAGQDGNREWITVLATICADGSSLPPALIYASAADQVQDIWLEQFEPDTQKVHFSATSSGWTTDKHGLAWLETIFDRQTRDKARRSWRLLFLDSHGSHVTRDFIQKAHDRRILLGYFPPHATHRLQPLDVGCFGPLATYYSQGLDDLIRKSEGHTSLKKRDFFTVFHDAFLKAFTNDNVSSAFKKTGLWPFDPSEVMQLFGAQSSTPVSKRRRRDSITSDEIDSPSKLKKLRRDVGRAAAVSDSQASRTVQRLEKLLLRTGAELVISRLNEDQLRGSLSRLNRHKRRRKRPFEQLRADDGAGALFLSPSKVQHYRDIIREREKAEEQAADDKAIKKAERSRQKLEKEAVAHQKREERVAAATARRAAAAEKKAAAQQAREARQSMKQVQEEQQIEPTRQRAAPKKPMVKGKTRGLQAMSVAIESPREAKTSKGRIVRVPIRFRRD